MTHKSYETKGLGLRGGGGEGRGLIFLCKYFCLALTGDTVFIICCTYYFFNCFLDRVAYYTCSDAKEFGCQVVVNYK